MMYSLDSEFFLGHGMLVIELRCFLALSSSYAIIECRTTIHAVVEHGYGRTSKGTMNAHVLYS